MDKAEIEEYFKMDAWGVLISICAALVVTPKFWAQIPSLKFAFERETYAIGGIFMWALIWLVLILIVERPKGFGYAATIYIGCLIYLVIRTLCGGI